MSWAQRAAAAAKPKAPPPPSAQQQQIQQQQQQPQPQEKQQKARQQQQQHVQQKQQEQDARDQDLRPVYSKEAHATLMGSVLQGGVRDCADRTGTGSLAHDKYNAVYALHGMANPGNMCFMAASLQALMGLSPFRKILEGLSGFRLSSWAAHAPVLARLVAFFDDFPVYDVRGVLPVAPTYIGRADREASPWSKGNVLALHALFPLVEGFSSAPPTSRQEDAQEFLAHVLERMHAEMVDLHTKLKDEDEDGDKGDDDDDDGYGYDYSSSGDDDDHGDDGDGWEEVGKNNKTQVVSVVASDTPTGATTGSSSSSSTGQHLSAVGAVFRGALRSIVRHGAGKPSATVQPFHVLPLDIRSGNIHRIEDALLHLAEREQLEQYTNKQGLYQAASKQLLVETLPPVLILHLARFSYDPHTATPIKVTRYIEYGSELEVPKTLLAHGRVAPHAHQRQYSLAAVISHHGSRSDAGHYTCDVRIEDGSWVTCDDHKVTQAVERDVLAWGDAAYVLMYTQHHQ